MESPKDMTPEEKKEHLKSIEAEIEKLEDLGRALTLLRAMEWMKVQENLDIKK